MAEEKEAFGDLREAGMLTTTGVQGVGKTYQNMQLINRYVRDKIQTKVKGRKVLIYDTNGEYNKEQFEEAGIKDLPVKLIKLEDVEKFAYSNLIEVRRVDAKSLGGADKKRILEYLTKYFRNGLLVLEDINTYVTQIHHMEEVVGKLVSLRHRATDVLLSYQSLRAVEPRIWGNSRWVRMHFQADSVTDVKDKMTNPELFHIAQILINRRFYDGDERFYLYITKFGRKVEGAFSSQEFKDACDRYLRLNKKIIVQYQTINDCTEKEAYEGQIDMWYKIYYDNPDKPKTDSKL